MKLGMWIMFTVSLVLLAVILIRNRQSLRGLSMVGLHIVAAALILYGVYRFGGYLDFHIPINAATVAVVGVLGMPGLAVLVCTKMWIIG